MIITPLKCLLNLGSSLCIRTLKSGEPGKPVATYHLRLPGDWLKDGRADRGRRRIGRSASNLGHQERDRIARAPAHRGGPGLVQGNGATRGREPGAVEGQSSTSPPLPQQDTEEEQVSDRRPGRDRGLVPRAAH